MNILATGLKRLTVGSLILTFIKAIIILALGAVFLRVALLQLGGDFPLAPEGQTASQARAPVRAHSREEPLPDDQGACKAPEGLYHEIHDQEGAVMV